MTDTRPCTCAPDERPYPCQHQYALGLCRKAEIRGLRIELDRCIAQIADLTKIRLEDKLVHGNVMGRIAVALFGDQNNRTDEECVARAAEIGYQLTGTQEALFQAQEAAKMLASEVAALRDQEKFNESALKGYRNNINDLKHDIARHVAIANEYMRDAMRYRWLRKQAFGSYNIIRFDFDLRGDIDNIDDVIDAALAKEE